MDGPQVDTRVKMKRLLERIEVCLPDLKAKLTPAADEELSATKAKFCLWFPPGLPYLGPHEFLVSAIGMLTWTCCARTRTGGILQVEQWGPA